MKKTITLALMMSAAAFGIANAQDMSHGMRSRVPAASPDTNFSIVYIHDDADERETAQQDGAYTHPAPQLIHEAQADLRKEPALRAGLEQRDVDPNNVVGVEDTGNGDQVVYVR